MAAADRATGPERSGESAGDSVDGDRGRLADSPGRVVVVADIVGTVVFVVTAFVAAIVFNSPTQWVAAIVALTLFLVGIAAFLWSFYNAVQRSRVEQVAVTQLYLHVGGIVPGQVRVPMLVCVLVQTFVGLLTAIWRANAADGSPGTSLALGVLVPMFGLGLNGLWAAYHGRFERRSADGHTDPADGHTDPADGHTDPADGHTDPADGHTDPADGHTDPADRRDVAADGRRDIESGA